MQTCGLFEDVEQRLRTENTIAATFADLFYDSNSSQKAKRARRGVVGHPKLRLRFSGGNERVASQELEQAQGDTRR